MREIRASSAGEPRAYRDPAIVPAGAVEELTGGPTDPVSENYGYQSSSNRAMEVSPLGLSTGSSSCYDDGTLKEGAQ